MNAGAEPDKSWNKMAAYYPGDTILIGYRLWWGRAL
jgi:hypothetical protein